MSARRAPHVGIRSSVRGLNDLEGMGCCEPISRTASSAARGNVPAIVTSFDIQRSLRNKIARRRLLNEMQRRE
jgi:hypothetical protein